MKDIEKIINEGYEFGMSQNLYEITKALEFVKNLNVKNFMEIGTDRGGTFLCWSKVSDPNGIKISVDWAHGPWSNSGFDTEERNKRMRLLGSNVHIFNGDSHSEYMHTLVKNTIKNEKLDFLFIDGDHSHIGVKLDYHMYKEFVKPGGWIGFHDIKDSEFHHNVGCYVDSFWNELENERAWFVSDNDWGGIGFIKV